MLSSLCETLAFAAMLAFLALSLSTVASLERGASGNVSGYVGATQAHLARCSDGPEPVLVTYTCVECVGESAVHRRTYTPGDRGDQALARQNQVERHVQVQVARQAEESPVDLVLPEAAHTTSGKYVLFGRSGAFWGFGSDLRDRGSTRGRPLPGLDLIFAAWYVTWRPKQHLFVSASGFGSMVWIVVSQMFGVCVDASAQAAWFARVVSEGLSVFPSQYLSVFMLFHLIGGAEAVTCHSCYDQLEGCTGGASCPFLATPASNATNYIAAGITGLTALALFPREWMASVTRNVLDTLMSVARRPLAGSPLDLANFNLSQLAQAFKDRTAPRSDVLYEMAALIPGASTTEQAEIRLTIDTLKMIASVEPDHDPTKRSSVGEAVGVLMMLWALAGKIGSRASDSVCLSVDDSSASTSSTASRLTEKMTRSTSEAAFCERMTIFSALAHGLGIANTLASVRFFKDVAYDLMLRDRLAWQVAQELVMVYLSDVDNSASLTIGNIFESGAQDNRLARAKTSASKHHPGLDIFRAVRDSTKELKTGVKYNGKCTNTSDKFCISFNVGGDHSAKHLHADGACKFKHKCDSYVTGAGPDARCGGDHSRKDCTNPDKTNTKP